MTSTDGAPASESLVFDDRISLGDFVGVSFKNLLLNIVTLSFYRFWGKTEVRRKLWQRIRLNGEPFEYTGRGKDLFFGFLLALVVIGVPYLLAVLAMQFLPRPLGVLVLLIVYVGLLVMIGAAVFLAFRYIASRTTWRGIRFQLTGKPIDYAWAFIGYSLLTIVTLGWYAPAMSMKMAQKLWGQLRFGDQPLSWREPAKGPSIYPAFAVLWCAFVLGYLPLIVFSSLARMGGPVLADLDARMAGAWQVMGLIALAFPVWLIVMGVAWAWYHSRLLRRMAASIGFGDARFTLRVGPIAYLNLAFTNVLILVFTLGILLPVIQARTARFIIRRLKSEGAAPLTEALQAPQGPRTGEGLADAFDIGII